MQISASLNYSKNMKAGPVSKFRVFASGGSDKQIPNSTAFLKC